MLPLAGNGPDRHFCYMRPRRPRFDGGFSIVEVLMAAAILMVGFVGLIQALTIGSESLDVARKQQVAAQIVTAEIERLRSGDWSSITSLPASGTLSINASGAASGDVTSFALTNRTAATDDDNTELCGVAKGLTCSFTRAFLRPVGATATTATYVKVAYTVTWTTNTGRVQHHEMEAYFAKSGLHLSYQQS